MQIALFTDTFPPQVNGVSLTLKRLVNHLERRGVLHEVFVPEFSKLDLFESNIHRFTSLPFYLYPECRIALPNLLSVRNHLRRFQPDLIHIATPFNMGLCGLHYGKKFGIPMVSSYHTHFDRYLDYYHLKFATNWIWRYLRWFHESCEVTFVPSEETRRQLENQGFSRIDIWKRGVDCDLFHPNKRNPYFRKKYGIKDQLLFLYVGRMAPEKDLDILFEIMNKLPMPIRERIHWLLVGEGPLLPELRDQALPNVTFAGYLSGEDLAEAYASADLFVFPSSTETFGNVVLEASASGLMTLGAHSGGVQEIIQHGKSGFLCSPRSVDSFLQAIFRIVEKPGLLHQMGKEARRYALSQSWDAILDGLLLQYEQSIYCAKKGSTA